MNMMHKNLLWLVLLASAISTPVFAAAEADRAKLLDFFAKKYPDVKFENMIHGAMVFSPDAKAQYDSIMDMPPFLDVLDAGKKMWNTPFKNGKTYTECMPNGGKMIAGNYPLFDDTRGKVVTFEDVINECRKANGEEPYSYGDMSTMGVLTAYARTLSDGMKVNIKVESAGAQKAFEAGKKSYYARAGQLNFSCANCHIDQAGFNLRSEILSPVIGQATHWPVFRGKDGGDVATTLQKRYSGCYSQVRHVSDKEGSERLNNLEYFHTYLSNGLEMKSAIYRK